MIPHDTVRLRRGRMVDRPFPTTPAHPEPTSANLEPFAVADRRVLMPPDTVL